jgi:hypothetical protein
VCKNAFTAIGHPAFFTCPDRPLSASAYTDLSAQIDTDLPPYRTPTGRTLAAQRGLSCFMFEVQFERLHNSTSVKTRKLKHMVALGFTGEG